VKLKSMHGNNDSTSRVTRTTAEGIAMAMAMVAVVGSEDLAFVHRILDTKMK